MRLGVIAANVAVALVMWSALSCAEPTGTPAGTSAGGPTESRDLCGKPSDPGAVNACTAIIQSALSSRADVAEAEMWRGMAYRRQGQFELAIADLTSSIETSKGLVDHFNLSIEYINRGRTYEVQGFHQDALSDFKRAVALDPRSYAGYEGLGVVHQDMGFHDLAIADYTRAIALQPTYGALYVYRANSYQAEGLQDQAIVDYARAITIITPDVARSSPVLHADLATAYNGRAWSYHLKMEDALALPDAEEAVTLAPQSAEAIETRAEVYERLGRRDDAIAEYRAALKLRPAMVPAKNGLVRLGAGP